MPRLHTRSPLVLLAAIACSTGVFAGEPPITAAGLIPADAVGVVSLCDGDRRVDDLREWINRSGILETAGLDEALNTPQALQGRLLLQGIAATAGVDVWKAIGGVLGREVAVAIRPAPPHGSKLLVVLIPREPALVDRLVQLALAASGAVARRDDAPRREVSGVEITSIGKDGVFCKLGDAYLLSNDEALLADAIRARDGKCLAKRDEFIEATRAVPDGAVLRAWVDVAAIRRVMPQAKWPEKMSEPLPAFLFGGAWHAIRTSEQALAWAQVDRGVSIELRVRGDELPASHRGYAPSGSAVPAWSAIELPRGVGELSLSRDWAALLAEREALLTVGGASDAVNFVTTMSNLLGGVDFLGDVLTKLDRPMRLIVAAQDFAGAAAVPSPQLPAFALVVPLDPLQADAIGQRLMSASQTAISLVNFQLGQSGQPQYLLDIDRHHDTRIVYAAFPTDGGGAMMGGPAMSMQPASAPGDVASQPRKLPIRYNFAPAAAVARGHYVVATTRTLLCDVIDRLIDAKPDASADERTARDALHLSGAAVVSLLRANREELVANRMLEQDSPRRSAERDIDTFLAILDRVDRLELSAQRSPREFTARLALRVRG